jgi:hypothetical protein
VNPAGAEDLKGPGRNLPQLRSAAESSRKIMVVIKMRGGNHAKDIREYEITSKGVVILDQRLTSYQGLISGIPAHLKRPAQEVRPPHDSETKN